MNRLEQLPKVLEDKIYKMAHEMSFADVMKEMSFADVMKEIRRFADVMKEIRRGSYRCPCCSFCRGKTSYTTRNASKFIRHIILCCQKANEAAHCDMNISRELIGMLEHVNTALRMCLSERWSSHIKAAGGINNRALRRRCLALLKLAAAYEKSDFDDEVEDLLYEELDLLYEMLPESFKWSSIHQPWVMLPGGRFLGELRADELGSENLFPNEASFCPHFSE